MAKRTDWDSHAAKTKQMVDELTSCLLKQPNLNMGRYLNQLSVNELVMLQIKIGKILQAKLSR